MTASIAEAIAAAEEALLAGNGDSRDRMARLLSGAADFDVAANTEDRARLALLLDALGLPDEAVRCLHPSNGNGQPDQDKMLLNLEGVLAANRGQHGRALRAFQAAQALTVKDGTRSAAVVANQAAAFLLAGDAAQAASQIAGIQHSDTDDPAISLLLASVQVGLARLDADPARFRRAAATLAAAARSRIAQLGPEHPQSLVIVATLAAVEFEVACLDDSAEHRERAITVLEIASRRIAAELGADNPQALLATANLAVAEAETARLDGTAVDFQAAVAALGTWSERFAAVVGSSHPQVRAFAATVSQARNLTARAQVGPAPARLAEPVTSMPEVAGFHTDFAPVVPESSPVRSTTRFQRHSARGSRSALARGFARSLQALLRERHVTVTEAAARMPAWELDAVRAYLSGTRLPSWDFVLTLIDATAASDHQQRNPIEQRLWNEWTAAASSPAPSRARHRRTSERELSDRPQPRVTLRASIATALAVTALAAAAFLAGAYLDAHRYVTRNPEPVAPLALFSILSPPQVGSISSVAWNPAGALIAASDDNSYTYVWSVTGLLITPPLVGSEQAIDATFNPSGTVLATGYATGKTYLWDTRNWRLLGRLTDPGKHSGAGVTSLTFSPDGKTLATGDANGFTALWHIQAGAPNAQPIAILSEPHHAGVLSTAFSSTGVLATGDVDGKVYTWDLATKHEIASFALHVSTCQAGPCAAVTALAFSTQGQVLAAGNKSGHAQLWDSASESGNPITLPAVTAHHGIWGLSFNPSGLLAIASTNGYSYLYHVSSGTLKATPARSFGDPDPGLHGVAAVAFSPDGNYLATGDSNGQAYLWQLNQRRATTLPPPKAGPTAQSEATSISNLLMSSANSRSQWNATTLVNNTGNCVDIDQDVTQIGDIANSRSNELSQLQNLQFDQLPNGASLKSQLMTALQDSLQIDNDYLKWAQQQQSSGCAYGFNNTYYDNASAEDNTVTSDKQTFLNGWDPIASQYNLEQFAAGEFAIFFPTKTCLQPDRAESRNIRSWSVRRNPEDSFRFAVDYYLHLNFFRGPIRDPSA